MLIGPIAAATEGIRVGSGGVMLPHYSPLKVAESFTILAALYPGRIDLGIGRAAGTDPLTMFALQQDRRQAAADDFPQKLAEMLGYFDDDLPEDHPFRHLAKTLPGRPELPVPWLLGSSDQSAIWAGELGLRYAFADFINPDGADIARIYRERFTPARDLKAPRTAVAVWALAAPTDEEAQFLASQQPHDVHAAAPRQADRRSRRPRRPSEFLAREARLTPSGDIPGRRGDRRLARDGPRRHRGASPPPIRPTRSSWSPSPTTTACGGAPTSSSPRPWTSSRGPRRPQTA